MEKSQKNLQLVRPTPSNRNPGEMSRKQILIQEVEVSEEEKRQLARTIQKKKSPGEDTKQSILRKVHLVNKLNYINFQDGTISLRFKHSKYERSLSLEAKPMPCNGDRLDCQWIDSEGIESKLKSYQFDTILINDGQKLILVEADLIGIDVGGISFDLPESCRIISNRKVMRNPCRGVSVQLVQNSSVFQGTLLYFNSISFHIELIAKPPQTFNWINQESSVELIISDEKETYYTGACRIIKETAGQKSRAYILEPLKDQIHRFKHKEFRSSRQQLTPSPEVVFKHPLTKKVVSLKVWDISGSGFSVEEDLNSALLVPGMIIPELELNFGINYKINCRAQVVYKKVYQEKKGDETVKCGLAMLDIDIQDHARLLALLQQAENKNSYVCNQVDMNALWDFFFETGFIYPDKYEYIQKNKQQVKEIYEKLYTRNPNIARHFIYQDKGRILGHMAMVRFFENTWLIHHHAARKSALNRAGLIVLNQIGKFTYDSYRLYSLHMDFLMCYYRPENKFPSRVFGGAARHINSQKGCSLDTFAFFRHRSQSADNAILIKPWHLTESGRSDFFDLEDFYEYASGGLILNAMDLEPGMDDINNLSQEYQRLGFKREKYCFSLKKGEHLKAFILVMLSDIGLNLSNLTNCIMVFVVDSEDLSWDKLHNGLSKVMHTIGQSDIPILLYPTTYAEAHRLPCEKQYNLWILNTPGNSDRYFSYVKRLLRYVK